MSTVLSPDTDRTAWLEARRKGIGASEIAAVLGISPWESPFSLYHRKINGWEIEETDAMRTGTFLEPTIAEWATETIDPMGHLYITTMSLRSHPERPWELATPDRVIYLRYPIGGDVPAAVLECKWTHSWDGWGDDATDDVPVHYRAQVLWQCDVLGAGEWYISALGPSGFRLFHGRTDADDIAVMVEAGRRFMARLEAGDSPPLDDHHATLTTLKRLHPDLDDVDVEVPADVAAGYARACAMERKAKALKQRYETRLLAQMGGAHRATSGGRRVATRVITEVAGYTVGPHRKDYLLPPREAKKP